MKSCNQNTFLLKDILGEHTQTAITRLLYSLVAADGFVYEAELGILDNIYSKYGITTTHRNNVSTMSLASAINHIVNEGTIFLGPGKEKKNNLFDSLYADMNNIAMVNGSVSHDEAMLLIVMDYARRYAHIGPKLHVFEYVRKSIRFARCEVIYIDTGPNEAGNKVVREQIQDNYESISSTLALYGFRFVYIPFVQRDMLGTVNDGNFCEDNLLDRVLRYMYPMRANNTMITSLRETIAQTDMSRFALQVMQEGGCGTSFAPSLLFKFGESDVCENGCVRKVFDLVQVPITGNGNDNDSVLKAVQDFVGRYRELRGSVSTCHCYDRARRFGIKSFQRTLVDFYIALKDAVKCVRVEPRPDNKDKYQIRFSDKDACKLSIRELAYYLFVIYYSKTRHAPMKYRMYKDDEEWKWCVERHRRILRKLRYSKDVSDVSLLEEIDIGSTINKKLDNFMDSSNCAMYHIHRDTTPKTVSIKLDLPVEISYKGATMELCEWVDTE